MNVSHNIADLSKVLPLYQQLSNKSAFGVLQKVGGNLGRFLYRELRSIRPPKGSIRANALAILAGGGMIKVRPSIRESVRASSKAPRFNVSRREAKLQGVDRRRLTRSQEMVRREIAIRESGRGVLARSVSYPLIVADQMKALSRYGTAFSEVNLNISGDLKYVRFAWPGTNTQSQRVLKGIESSKGQAALNRAIRATRDDMMVYVQRKQAELVRKVVKAMVK
jgi:hypothetical protein